MSNGPRIVNEGITREDVQTLARFAHHAAAILYGEEAIVPFDWPRTVRDARMIAERILAQETVVVTQGVTR